MTGSVVRKLSILGAFVAAAVAPTASFADPEGWYYFNDGQGNCGYVECGAYGCQVIDTFPCPREVGGN
jgi:hypothetical protein